MTDIVEEVVAQEPPRPVGAFYLRFSSEEEFLQAAEEAGFVNNEPTEWEDKEKQEIITDPDGNDEIIKTTEKVPVAWKKVLITSNFGYFIDVVGSIAKGGKWEVGTDGEVVEVEAPVTLDGWHVNYSGVLPKSFDSAVLSPPNNPVRKYSVGAYDPAAPVDGINDLSI